MSIAFITTLILLVPGFIMAFTPLFPALSYMFVIALLFAFYERFTVLSVPELGILLAITGISIVIDHVSGLMGARYGGAHAKSLLWGVAGALLGFFFIPVFGSFIGLFLGVLCAEIYYQKTHRQALKAAGGALVGTAVGVMVNAALALSFIIIFSIIAFT